MRSVCQGGPTLSASMPEPLGKVRRNPVMLLAALPILIELFTSEGCSSCPPADAVLQRLWVEQPLAGVRLVVLSEHVDYWNDLGWRDPWSDPLFSDRQRRYGGRIYTPQAVIDGRVDVVGSDEEGIVRAAKGAAAEAHGEVRIAPAKKNNFFSAPGRPESDGRVHIATAGLPPHGPAQVLLAVVEDGLVSRVERGENAGRTLPHTAVVRSLKSVGSIAPGAAAWEGDADAPSDPAWKSPRVVVFVQDRESLRVLAAGSM